MDGHNNSEYSSNRSNVYNSTMPKVGPHRNSEMGRCNKVTIQFGNGALKEERNRKCQKGKKLMSHWAWPKLQGNCVMLKTMLGSLSLSIVNKVEELGDWCNTMSTEICSISFIRMFTEKDINEEGVDCLTGDNHCVLWEGIGCQFWCWLQGILGTSIQSMIAMFWLLYSFHIK